MEGGSDGASAMTIARVSGERWMRSARIEGGVSAQGTISAGDGDERLVVDPRQETKRDGFEGPDRLPVPRGSIGEEFGMKPSSSERMSTGFRSVWARLHGSGQAGGAMSSTLEGSGMGAGTSIKEVS